MRCAEKTKKEAGLTLQHSLGINTLSTNNLLAAPIKRKISAIIWTRIETTQLKICFRTNVKRLLGHEKLTPAIN